MNFEELGVMPPILRALEQKAYKTPTPIQAKAIPLILNRKDVLGCAQTGTGKTAAFAIPIIQLIQKIEGNKKGKPVIRSLIVTPTRELAIQIDENIKAYSEYTNIRHTVIFGGVKQGAQVSKLRDGVHILVIHDIRKLLKLLPERRQSLFFSATMPNNIVELSQKILHQPVKIEVAPVSSAAETVKQFKYYTNKNTKKDLLASILKDESMEQI